MSSNVIVSSRLSTSFALLLTTLLAGSSPLGAEVRVGPGALAAGREPAARPAAKTDVASAELLLPYFEVDTTDPEGVSTFFTIRNETEGSVPVTIRYYETHRPRSQPAQRTESLTLGPKRVRSFNLRQVPDLLVDGDGVARGYATISTDGGGAAIQGDYFQIDEGGNFASGDRLVNAGTTSQHNQLCQLFTVRFFNGGSFDGGTRLTFWLDADAPPSLGEPIAFYTVYSEAGGTPIFTNQLFSTDLAFQVLASELLTFPGIPAPSFGALEIQFNATVGHVWATFTANDRFSVGLDAVCLDF